MLEIDEISGQLERVNDGRGITPDFELPDGLLPQFSVAFDQLNILLRGDESISSTPQTRSPFPTPPTQIITPDNAPLPASAPQAAHLLKSRQSLTSIGSSASGESQPEPTVNMFALDFLRA